MEVPREIPTQGTEYLVLTTFNIRSLHSKKIPDMNLLFEEYLVDLAVLTETWCNENTTEEYLRSCIPTGYKFLSVPRLERRGGGIGLVYNDHIVASLKKTYKFETMECAEFEIKYDDHRAITICAIYRPPSTDYLKFSEEILQYIENNVTLFTGDFNIHFDVPEDPATAFFNDVLYSLGLQAQVSFPTHQHGHTLDQVIIPEEGFFSIKVHEGPFISDHKVILSELSLVKPKAGHKKDQEICKIGITRNRGSSMPGFQQVRS